MTKPAGAVKVYGLLGLAAARQKAGGAWRLWTLARALDDGRGLVNPGELRTYVCSLGTSAKCYKRWLAAALRLGLLEWWGERLRYASLRNASRILKADPGYPAWVPAAELVGPGWRRWIWAAFLKANTPGRPISRETLQALSGVAPRTQLELERGIVRTRRNWAVWSVPKGHKAAPWAEYLRERHPGAFVFLGRRGSRPRRVAWALPNSYQTPESVQHARRGMSRKIRRELRTDLLNCGRRVTAERVRLFHEAMPRARRAREKLAGSGVMEVYAMRRKRRDVWTCYPVAEPLAF